MSLRRLGGAAVVITLLIAGWHERVLAFPVDGDQTALPAKTELNEDALSGRAKCSTPRSTAASQT